MPFLWNSRHGASSRMQEVRRCGRFITVEHSLHLGWNAMTLLELFPNLLHKLQESAFQKGNGIKRKVPGESCSNPHTGSIKMQTILSVSFRFFFCFFFCPSSHHSSSYSLQTGCCMWERGWELGGMRGDKEGIVLLVVESQHSWIFSALGVVVGQNMTVKSGLSLLQVPLN